MEAAVEAAVSWLLDAMVSWWLWWMFGDDGSEISFAGCDGEGKADFKSACGAVVLAKAVTALTLM